MDKRLMDWISEILLEHESLLEIALRQRAKFEGWLKFELAVTAEKYGAKFVKLEPKINPHLENTIFTT